MRKGEVAVTIFYFVIFLPLWVIALAFAVLLRMVVFGFQMGWRIAGDVVRPLVDGYDASED